MALDKEKNGTAPTTSIQTLIIVRPLKVIAVILAALAMFLMVLSIAASTWLEASGERQGLWDRCRYHVNNTNELDCTGRVEKETDWLQACRALCMVAMILTFFGVVVTSVGLRTDNFRYKHRYYLTGMVLWFTADGLQLISLVTYPIKFLDDVTKEAELHWQFGWAYGIGWGAAIFVFVAGLILLIDNGAEEVSYREITTKKDDVEAEPLDTV